jgi:hypothetical protein
MSLQGRLNRLEHQLGGLSACPMCSHEHGHRVVTMRRGEPEPSSALCTGCGRGLPTVVIVLFA